MFLLHFCCYCYWLCSCVLSSCVSASHAFLVTGTEKKMSVSGVSLFVSGHVGTGNQIPVLWWAVSCALSHSSSPSACFLKDGKAVRFNLRGYSPSKWSRHGNDLKGANDELGHIVLVIEIVLFCSPYWPQTSDPLGGSSSWLLEWQACTTCQAAFYFILF